MRPPKHVSPPLAQLLERISSSLAFCDPDDPARMSSLLRELGDLEKGLEHEQAKPLADLARVSHRLVDRLAADGLVGPSEALEVVGQALAAVRVELGLEEERTTAPPSPASKPAQLSLLDGRRLGELLVTLSMLQPSDVERALEKQRSTGMLLGEALVELGIVGRGSVDAALRLQSSRRRRESVNDDPWALPSA